MLLLLLLLGVEVELEALTTVLDEPLPDEQDEEDEEEEEETEIDSEDENDEDDEKKREEEEEEEGKDEDDEDEEDETDAGAVVQLVALVDNDLALHDVLTNPDPAALLLEVISGHVSSEQLHDTAKPDQSAAGLCCS